MNDNIKWACIQPLTGGMYIGTQEAIGHPAEWILSYDGLDSVKYDKDENIISASNEYNLLKWLEGRKINVPYYKIKNRKMFDSNIYDVDVDIYLNEDKSIPDYKNIDLVVAVPVCSGLSVSTRAGSMTKESRNCNMLWLAYYTLNVIKPKVYCFENAPTLMTDRGDEVRNQLEDIAYKSGYSVLYYKTDTCLHNNCQRRPRTFVIFIKWGNTSTPVLPPIFSFENKSVLIPEFFESISKDSPQQDEVKSFIHNYAVLDFLNHKFGDSWIGKWESNLVQHLLKEKLGDELNDFIINSSKYSNLEKEKILKYINHIYDKKSLGLNYYSEDVCYFNKLFPSVQFRSIPNMLHYSGKRFCTIREYLSLMGLPEDFILYGNDLSKIGQNVPVGTAKFIVSNILNILNNWNYINRETKGNKNVIYQNNIKQKTVIL